MGFGKRPQAPDPYQTSQVQQQFNRDSLRDAIAASQIGQETPFGAVNYTGQIGSPDRKQTVTLNPQDQTRLDSQRAIQGGLLNMVLGGQRGGGSGKQGPGQQPPQMPGM